MQPSLFSTSPLPAYQRGSRTSKAAAVKARTFSGNQRARLYAAIAVAPRGLTQKEMAAQTGISRQSICLRVRELERAGEIGKAGMQREGCEAYKVLA